MHYEIERKYLIRYPDLALLAAQDGCEVWNITQTYLTGEPGETRRVRKVVCAQGTFYYRTFKRRASALTAEENESALDLEAYEQYLTERDPASSVIFKTRYRIPYEGHTIEVDLYPFWSDRAIMEVELDSEDEAALLPDYIRVIRDVSGEKAYKNRMLALKVPMETL